MSAKDIAPHSRLAPLLRSCCCKNIDQRMRGVFSKVSLPITSCFYSVSRFAIVDYGHVISLKTLNFVSKIFCKGMNIQPFESMNKKRKAENIERYSKAFLEGSICPDFCKITAGSIYEFIPLAIAEQSRVIPSHVENWVLYRAGLTVRYFCYKTNQHTGYRSAVISSATVQRLHGHFSGVCTNLSHAFLGRESLERLVSFEELLLELLSKLRNQDAISKKWAALVFISVGRSLEQQTAVEKYLNRPHFRTEEERLIGRLQWHKKDESLPKGLPDPSSLTTKNLYENLDQALHERIERLVAIFLKKMSPNSLKQGLFGFLYVLEGRDGLVQVLSHLVIENGIKQITDPHLFALAILYAAGEDVIDYELDGFGRDKSDEIVVLGKKIIQAKGKRDWFETIRLYEESDLRASKGGEERLLQQQEAKEHLTRFIEKLIYSILKKEESSSSTIFKDIRERTTQLPVIGIATLFLHSLINGMFYSFEYLVRKKENETSFLQWMVQKFAGKNLSYYLATRIVELVYHPSWRITVMQVLDLFTEQGKELSKEDSLEGIKQITAFLFRHFVPKSEFAFEERILPYVEELTSQTILEQIELMTRSSNQSLLENGLATLMPSIKEVTLYCKVVSSFRREKITFKGDQKFWEVFVRESLNRLVAAKAQKMAKVSQAKLREEFVDLLLSFQQKELREYLVAVGDPQEWELVLTSEVGRENLDLKEETIAHVASLTNNIQWAYATRADRPS